MSRGCGQVSVGGQFRLPARGHLPGSYLAANLTTCSPLSGCLLEMVAPRTVVPSVVAWHESWASGCCLGVPLTGPKLRSEPDYVSRCEAAVREALDIERHALTFLEYLVALHLDLGVVNVDSRRFNDSRR